MPDRAGSWIESAEGLRRRLGAGLLLGRGPSADVLLDDVRASNRHALLRDTPAGAELYVLGRNPTRVNGEEVEGVVLLAAGDVIEVPGGRFTLSRSELSPPATTWWRLEVGGQQVGVPRHAMRLGGAPDDELFVPAWPPNGLVLHTVGDHLIAEAQAPGFRVGTRLLDAEDMVRLAPDQGVDFRGHVVWVRAERAAQEQPTHASADLRRWRYRFTYLPNGGELSLEMGPDQATVRLSELRCRLVASLLAPPGEYRPGDIVPDELLLSAVWPRQIERSRYDLNTLVHRLRGDLLKAGVDPTGLVERVPGGIRWILAGHEQVEVL